jgi:hypothetical protein
MEVVSLGYPLGMFGVSFGMISWLIRGGVDAEPRRVGGRYETGRREEVGGRRKKGAKNAEFIGGFGGQNTFFYKKKSCTLAYIKNYV